jgi:UMF1 family MFS transporter
MSRLAAFGLHRPELRAWAMYDLANSTFVTSVVTVFYPIYFARTADPHMSPAAVTGLYVKATTVALAAIAVLSPFLGLLADHYAVRKKMLGVCLTVALLCTVGLAATPPGMAHLSLLLFGLANVGASGSFVFYDALLPHIARPQEIDRVSSAGYALGYLGGGVLLALNVLMVARPRLFGMPDDLSAMRLAFLSVAIWWAIFSLPLFRRVPEPPGSPLTEQERSKGVWGSLGETFADLRRFDQALLMMAAFLVYNDGIGTIIRMTAVYGTEIGMSQLTMTGAFLFVQFMGIPFTFIFGAFASRFGPKRSIGVALVTYAMVAVVAWRMKTSWEFWLLALLIAVVQGGCQALSRSLFASMIPERKSSQFFAFFGVAEKFAGVFGSLIFALLQDATGDSRVAVLSLTAFFVAGGVLLSKVDVARGRAHAVEVNERLAARAAESGEASGP